MDYIDTHCHLDSILAKMKLSDYADLKTEYFPPNFAGCISISCDPDSIEALTDLMQNSSVYGAFGIHPHDAQHYNSELELRLVKTMAYEKTVAWGEIGLDYHYEFSPKDIQKDIFARQIRKAIEVGKPLIIHTREAEEDTLAIMQSEIPIDWKIHVHCFTSSLIMAEKLLASFPNLCLGFTGIVTFKNALELQAVAIATPLERFLLETDGPYLAPIPHRGKPAHPGHIPLIAQKIAELKGVEVDEIYRSARENTRKIYGF
jgi:TatD DNase family protein